ncbi:hypothetical protein ABTZ03_19610 [Kitasatospora sp. NPDC096077]|uniref:hypothetical protein n=1 Tax=Kitasatospora sp. NPDC096077 TaxID=3155544 RepID=UPI003318AF2C
MTHTSNGAARCFLENSPFTDGQKADIGHRNWDRLTARAGFAAARIPSDPMATADGV